MRENIRRPILFLATVIAGSMLIVFEVPPLLLILGTVFAGVLVLIGTGALPLHELKPSLWIGAIRTRLSGPRRSSSIFARFSKKKEKKSSKPHPLRTFAASIRESISMARAPEHEKKAKLDQIDQMLASTIEGNPPDKKMPDMPAPASGGAADSLMSLADLDDESFNSIEIEGEFSRIAPKFDNEEMSMLSAEEANAVSDILKAHQDELEDTPGGKSPASLSGMPTGDIDLSGADLKADLSELDELNLDEIDIDEEIEGGALPAEAADISADIKTDLEKEEPEEEPDMVSFASGGFADDGLMADLRSDVKKKKVEQDVSLLRDLKGKKFKATDLGDELAEIIRSMPSKE